MKPIAQFDLRIEGLFDSHAHLSDECFKEDFFPMLKRAKKQGVEAVLMPSTTLEDATQILSLIEERDLAVAEGEDLPTLYAAVGIHPHEAAPWEMQNLRGRLTELSAHPAVCAIGEVGLDYYYDFVDREVQKKLLKQQIQVAYEVKKPLVLHDREAHEDFLNCFLWAKSEGLLLEEPGVVHCYSGSPDFAKRLLKLGFCFGFDGPITFKNAKQGLETIRILPKEKLLIETDSPYLTPVPHRGKRNEPATVAYVAEAMAQCLDLSVQALAELTATNAKRLFGFADAKL